MLKLILNSHLFPNVFRMRSVINLSIFLFQIFLQPHVQNFIPLLSYSVCFQTMQFFTHFLKYPKFENNTKVSIFIFHWSNFEYSNLKTDAWSSFESLIYFYNPNSLQNLGFVSINYNSCIQIVASYYQRRKLEIKWHDWAFVPHRLWFGTGRISFMRKVLGMYNTITSLARVMWFPLPINWTHLPLSCGRYNTYIYIYITATGSF